MEWPIYFKNNLSFGNLNSSLAICSLWTKQDQITKFVSTDMYCLLGNLYSRDGINYIIRNILAHPSIRHIIVCGNDRTNSGNALVNFFYKGIDKDRRVIDDGIKIEDEIDLEAIELLRANVKIYDMREVDNLNEIKSVIMDIDFNVEPFWREGLVFDRTDPQTETFPSENTVFPIRGEKIIEVWLRLLNTIMRFGHLEETEYSLKQKELLNAVVIISKEDPDNVKLPSWLPFSQQFLGGDVKGDEYQMMLPLRNNTTGEWMGGYYAQILTPIEIPDLSYTYGTRLFKYKNIDQIQSIIDKLKAVRFTRRAVAILWIPTEDYDSQHPPCLDLIQAKIRGNKLFLTAYFRSHDIYGAWPQNVFALRKLQKYIAEKIESVELGDLIVISQSAHIYQDSWEEAKRIISKYYPKYVKNLRFERDPRGSFVIRIERPNIVLDHYTLDGEHISTLRGRRADTLINRITPFISQLSHAVYLGSELQKAEFALKLNLNYVQDVPLDIDEYEIILSEE